MKLSISRKGMISASVVLLLGTGLTLTGVALASTTPTTNPPGVQSDGHSVDPAQVPTKVPALDANGDRLRDIDGHALCIATPQHLPLDDPPSKEDLQGQVIAVLLEGGSITIGGTTYTAPTPELMQKVGVDTNTDVPVETNLVTREITAADAVRC